MKCTSFLIQDHKLIRRALEVLQAMTARTENAEPVEYQERSLVEGLEDALCTKKGSDFVYFANRLMQLLNIHIQNEEEVMFRIADESLSDKQDEHIVSELEKFIVQPGVVADLQHLEWTYLRKTGCA
jgi:hemerythrin-like domain-containing protein